MLRANLAISAFNAICYFLGALVFCLIFGLHGNDAMNVSIIIGLLVFGATFAVVNRMQHG